MPALGNLLIAIAKVIDMVVGLYTLLIAGAVILSWVRPDPLNPIVRFIHSATEPLFSKVRRLLPSFLKRSGIDWTPMIVIILLVFLQSFLSGTLLDFGLSLKSRESNLETQPLTYLQPLEFN